MDCLYMKKYRIDKSKNIRNVIFVVEGGHGCPMCNSSSNEKTISNWLNAHNIKFEKEVSFPDLKGVNGGSLRIDFHILCLDVYIEYQSKQHYEIIEHFGGKQRLEYQKSNDNIKRSYMKSHKYNYLEIMYNDDINETLNKIIYK